MRDQVQAQIDAFKRDPEIRKIVNEHSKVNSWRQMIPLLMNWSIIIGAAYLCSLHFTWWSYAAAIVIIGARQHGLAVIVHEAAHLRLFKNIKYDDLISNFFAAYPALATTDDYRRNHSAHHSATNTDKDPDWKRKIPVKDWQYPQTHSRIAWTMTKQLMKGGLEWVVFMTILSIKDWKKWAYWAVGLTVLHFTGMTQNFLLYWVVPLMVVFPSIQRTRSIAEHFGLPYDHEFNGTRNVISGPIETFMFGPHNVRYHLVHHLFPTVPQYNLKKLHEELMRKSPLYAQHAHNNSSYFAPGKSVLKDLTENGTEKQKQNNSVAA